MDQLPTLQQLEYLESGFEVSKILAQAGFPMDKPAFAITWGQIAEEIAHTLADHGLPLPHMGWNRVYAKAGDRLFRGIEDGAYFYFVHSYAMPVNPYTIAQCNYGEPFTAAVQKDNFFGVQFHPERSGAAGAQLLKNFLEM